MVALTIKKAQLSCVIQSNDLSTRFSAVSCSHLVRKSLSESVRELGYRKWKVNTQIMKALGFPQKHVCKRTDKQNVAD